jgi:hypothetical protein
MQGWRGPCLYTYRETFPLKVLSEAVDKLDVGLV